MLYGLFRGMVDLHFDSTMPLLADFVKLKYVSVFIKMPTKGFTCKCEGNRPQHFGLPHCQGTRGTLLYCFHA